MLHIPIPARNRSQALLGLAGAFLALLLLAVLAHAGVHVKLLQSAGVNFSNDNAISGISSFVTNIKSGLLWLVGTAVGLMAAVIGILFMTGHSRAQDFLIKAIFGLMIIVAVPGIVS